MEAENDGFVKNPSETKIDLIKRAKTRKKGRKALISRQNGVLRREIKSKPFPRDRKGTFFTAPFNEAAGKRVYEGMKMLR